MAQSPPKSAPPELVAGWSELLQRHQENLELFQHQVKEDRDKLEKHITSEIEKLLTRQRQEQSDFLGKHGQAQAGAPTAPTITNDARVQAIGNTDGRRTTVATPKKQQHARAPTTPSKASQTPRSSQVPPAPKKPRSRAPKKKPRTVFIDLTGSDGEEKPANETSGAQKSVVQKSATSTQPTQKPAVKKAPSEELQNNRLSTVPQATLELFGGKAKKQAPTLESPYIEKKHQHVSLSNQPQPSPFWLSRETPRFGEPSTFKPSMPPSTIDTPGLNGIGLPFSPSGFESRKQNKEPLLPDKRPEISLNSLRNQQHNRSAILKEPTPLARNQTLFALEQQRQNGSFVNRILQNERSQTLTPELSGVLGNSATDDNVEMEDASILADDTSTAPALHTPTKLFKAPEVVSPSPAFKKPTLPASVVPIKPSRQAAISGLRHVRAGSVQSHASSLTLPMSPRDGQSAPIASQISDSSARTGETQTRKRRAEINLSSDEDESDYAPSDPGSPLADKSCRQAKETHVIKKSKANYGTGVAIKSKNPFGFVRQAHKPKLATTPPTPPGTPDQVARASIRSPSIATSANSKLKEKPIPTKERPTVGKFALQPRERRSAKAAKGRIQSYFEEEQEFNTDCAIEDADQIEGAALPTGMRRMSITPSPTDRRASINNGQTQSVDMLADKPSPANRSPTATNDGKAKNGAAYDYSAWTHDRTQGDRHARKYQATVADYDSDKDNSEYIDIDGVAVRTSEVEELDLTDVV